MTTMKPPYSLTNGELKAYADEHLQYEFDMLVWSVGILLGLSTHWKEGHLPWAIHNALLNTFAIHARNLVDFLYSSTQGRDRATDIIIEDYLNRRDASVPPIPPVLDEAIAKASKQVPHLTKARIDYEKAGKEWKYIEVALEVVRVFSSVASRIPDSRMSGELKEKLTQPHLVVPTVDVLPGYLPNGVLVAVTFVRGTK